MIDFDSIPASDDLDALIASPKLAQARELPPIQGHDEPCPKCRGRGTFYSYSGRPLGNCFKCKGKGVLTFKQPAAVRFDNRQKAATRKARAIQESIDAFKAANPDVWAWLDGNTFDFAVKMRDALTQWGSLTDRQLAACVTCIQKRDAAKAAAVARVENAQVIDTSKIEAAFAAAGRTLQSPKLRVAGFVIYPAKASSANAGALYVRGGQNAETGEKIYFGKIAGGKFIRSRDCSEAQEAEFRAVAADPMGAAIAYGRVTGECACCGRTLTNKESIARGIGPICAQTFGW